MGIPEMPYGEKIEDKIDNSSTLEDKILENIKKIESLDIAVLEEKNQISSFAENDMLDNKGKIEIIDKDIIQVSMSSTIVKELFFEDDGTKVIFYFDDSNKWMMEVIEDYTKNTSFVLPKKKGIPMPTLFLKMALPDRTDINMKQMKEYLKNTVYKNIQTLDKLAFPEQVDMKKSKENVKNVALNDIKRLRKSAAVVLEMLISVYSSDTFSLFRYIRIVR